MRYEQPRQVLSISPGAVASLGTELAVIGVSHVCLVASARAMGSAAGAAVKRELQNVAVRYEFAAVRPHAPVSDTERMASEMVAEPPGAFVAVGGGSASDTAKALAILLAEGRPLAECCSSFSPPDQLRHVDLRAPKIPVISVPTTFSGAEITPGGGATDASGIKRVFWDQKVAARVVIMDAELIVDAPDDLLTTTGMNGLAHCAEALYSRTATPISSALAVEGARGFAAALPRLPGATGAERVEIIDQAFRAACIGGLVISNARVGLHHAICHVLGAALGMPHGVANAVLLPYVLEFNLGHTLAEQRRLADALASGLGEGSGSSAAHLVAQVQHRTGVPATLRDAGVAVDQLDQVAHDVMQDRGLFFNPMPVTDERAVRQLLDNAWYGRLAGGR